MTADDASAARGDVAGTKYRTCAECGADCTPEPFATSEGVRIAFTCPEHGPHSMVDPFEGVRDQ